MAGGFFGFGDWTGLPMGVGDPSAVLIPVASAGGYGGASYGLASYGSVDIYLPRLSSAVSIDGYRIEVFFSEPMRVNADLFLAANYTLTAVLGAPATAVSVLLGTPSGNGGYSSVIVTHTGTTTGGSYTITAVDMVDMAGNPVGPPGADTRSLLTLGDTGVFEVAATSGTSVEFSFFRSDEVTPQTMLTEAEFSPGITDLANYEISTDYPIDLTPGVLTHPVEGDASKASLTVTSMTSAVYDVSVGPADSILYDGSVLPSAATTFTGVAVGTGTSSASLATGLLLNKADGVTYGWAFEDTSGRVAPSSSYRMGFTFDVSSAVFVPSLFDSPAGTLKFSDDSVEIEITLNRVSGTDIIDIQSGAYTGSVPALWSTGVTTIELYRNQKAANYSIFVNGTPLVSVPLGSFTGVPAIQPGVQFVLPVTYAVTGFKITDLTVTSSQTLFTTAWNFLHSMAGSFTGDPASANDRILTKRGPLVKDWGDPTPATAQDVEVRLNGSPIAIASVNPYIGAIFPAIPIPLTPPGTNTIEIDYKWFPSPSLEMVGLNTPGLILNKWDLPRGHHEPGESPLPATSFGVADTARFPMGIVLPPLDRPQPILIGHRYMGFEQDYTASLNSPTTLLLNQNPHRVSVPGLEEHCLGSSATFDGISTPPLAELPWSLDGTDTGTVVGDGTYRLVDASAGTFAHGTATVYYREEDLACSATVNQIGRFKVESYETDGVFTGVGFGFHDNHRLYLAGALVVNDVKHIGLLTDAFNPHLVESWELGPAAEITITSATTFTVAATDLPSWVVPGSRFQILDGAQAGVYIISACGIDDLGDGTVVVTLDPSTPFPANPGLEGNDTATAVFEVLWDESFGSYRLIVDTESRLAQLYVGGTLTGLPITLTAPTAIPADTSLLIPTGNEGRLMFGSFSRIATNSTLWSFHRYDVMPEQATVHVTGLVVAAEMSDTPDQDANHEWFITNGFGYGEIDSSGDTLLLKSTSHDPTATLDYTFGYARIEPFLTRKVFTDVDATFKVETGILGAGDATIRVRDDLREARLSTLLYTEGGSPYRQLVSLGAVSFAGLQVPTEVGWTQASSPVFTATPSIRENTLTLTQTSGQGGLYSNQISTSAADSGSRVVDARFRVLSFTANGSGFAGPAFGATVGLGGSRRQVIATLKASPPRVALLNSSLVEVTAFAFAWDDGEFHDFRLIGDVIGNSVSVVADDTVIGVAALGAFPVSGTAGNAVFGAVFANVVSTTEWLSFHAAAVPLAAVKRTIGVYQSGDQDDIDSWVIPRTDGTLALNSANTAVVEEMDWRSFIEVRVHLDPTWGVSIYRPDLPPPPYFTGDFATQITDPTAAWINVEYARLPKHEDLFGSVYFGALDPRSVTQQRWGEVRYRLYNTPDENFISPHHMVLNQYNVITSGEFLTDTTPEVVVITSLTSTLVSIRSAHMNASRVFVVMVDDVVLPTTDWSFDVDSQTITLTNPLPSDSYPVTVTFAPGKPITNTYLCSQPLEGSVTLLNEGTPPVPLSQQATTTREVVSGGQVNDPSDTLNDDPDFILNDPFQVVTFEQGAEALYESLSFCTVDDGGETGLLSIACDGPAPEHGWIGMELSGHAYWDAFSVPGGPGGPWGSSSPVIGGTASSFNPMKVLVMGGGAPLNAATTTIGPGTAMLTPNYPGPDGPHRGQHTGVNQEIQVFALDYTIPFEDTFEIPETADNTPPSLPYTEDPNPDGTPGVELHGAAFAQTSDGASAGYSRIGPWGGLASLVATNSLMGGGAPLTGGEMTLNGGAAIGTPTVTDFQIEAAN